MSNTKNDSLVYIPVPDNDKVYMQSVRKKDYLILVYAHKHLTANWRKGGPIMLTSANQTFVLGKLYGH
jgi:hypothetical protein